MNSFQAQFNSLLGVALGAQKLGGKKTLGTPSTPTPTKSVEGSTKEEYSPLADSFETNFMASNVTADREYQMAMLAKERSLQNLYNRHNALKARKGELTFGGKK